MALKVLSLAKINNSRFSIHSEKKKCHSKNRRAYFWSQFPLRTNLKSGRFHEENITTILPQSLKIFVLSKRELWTEISKAVFTVIKYFFLRVK